MAKVAPAHRDLHMGDKHGDDVKEFQKACNARGRTRGITKLEVDGNPGRQTIAIGRQVGRALGVTNSLGAAGVSLYLQQKIRNPLTRNPVQLAKALKWKVAHPHGAVHILPVGPTRSNNTVTGGTAGQRVVYALMEAARLYYQGTSHRFYDQEGAWDVSHAITGEAHDKRSDCSQFAIGINHSAGAPDPAGTQYAYGNTDTIVSHCHEISRGSLRPGDFVLYFNGSSRSSGTHHIECWVGNGDGKTVYAALAHSGSQYRDRTVGHGSPPVDYGDIDMIAFPRFFRLP